ncbi:MAG TPA: hypothetical protein VGM31_11950, partial [Puia sp.]
MKVALLLLFTCFTGITTSVWGQPVNDLRVKVDTATGGYVILSTSFHWEFGGSVGQPVHDLHTDAGKDAVGVFKAISFTWQSDNSYVGTIRWYAQRPVVVFSLSLPQGAQHGAVTFPVLRRMPKLPYQFSYHNRIFPLPQFILEETSTPWLLFNDNADACVISPASDFMV